MKDIPSIPSAEYVPGCLLPDPVAWTGPNVDARDYVLYEFYAGTSEDGLPNLDDFANMVEAGAGSHAIERVRAGFFGACGRHAAHSFHGAGENARCSCCGVLSHRGRERKTRDSRAASLAFFVHACEAREPFLQELVLHFSSCYCSREFTGG